MKMLTLILLFLTSTTWAEDVDVTEHIVKEDFYQMFSETIEVGELNYETCTYDETKTLPKRVWPGAEHVKFCMDSGPKLYRSLQKNTDWNSEAIEFSLGWTLGEAGWQHFITKPDNKCLWGFSKNEIPTKCDAKSFDQGVKEWRNYLTDPHNPPDYYDKNRAKSCGPHRALVKNFSEKPGPLSWEYWSDENINLWLRSNPYVSKGPNFYNEKNPGEVLVTSSGRAKVGEAACTYNSVNPNYAQHIKQSLKNMQRWCKQVYVDFQNRDGVYTYLKSKPNYDKVKDLFTNADLLLKQNDDFKQLLFN